MSCQRELHNLGGTTGRKLKNSTVMDTVKIVTQT